MGDTHPTRVGLSWLRADEHVSTNRVLDEVVALLDVTPQRHTSGLARRLPIMNRFVGIGLAAAAVILVVLIGIKALEGPNPGGPGPAPSDSPASPDPSAQVLRALGLPGARGGPPGEYGWTGALGSSTGMHSVVEGASEFRQTQITFAVENECFAGGEGPEPVRMTVAGLDGLYVEPYQDPGVLFVARGGERTGAYALPIGDRTLCVYLSWDPATTQVELDAALRVVESIRGQPFGPDGIRINFTITTLWDTG
ncbi:MAG TPA: hypothetical protein VJK02_08765 [Anaerolineales bacterium]|nr:hypothetical protein [Anaerolineales bacterium]